MGRLFATFANILLNLQNSYEDYEDERISMNKKRILSPQVTIQDFQISAKEFSHFPNILKWIKSIYCWIAATLEAEQGYSKRKNFSSVSGNGEQNLQIWTLNKRSKNQATRTTIPTLSRRLKIKRTWKVRMMNQQRKF